jgi:hypothetical protein
MANLTVKVPQGFPVGTTLGVYVDRVGDIVPQGPPVSTAVIAADSTVALTGLEYGIPYQVGAVIAGTWRSFLVEIGTPAPSTFSELADELAAHEVDQTSVHGIAATAELVTDPDLAAEITARQAGDTTIPIVAKAANFTFALADAGKNHHVNAAGAVVATIDTDANVNFPVGTILGLGRYGAGAVSLAAAAGVTIRSKGGLLAIGNQFGFLSLQKIAANEWWVVGDLA